MKLVGGDGATSSFQYTVVPGAARFLRASSSTNTFLALLGVKFLLPVVANVPINDDKLSSGFHHQALAVDPATSIHQQILVCYFSAPCCKVGNYIR
jgi:hypothetical protein